MSTNVERISSVSTPLNQQGQPAQPGAPEAGERRPASETRTPHDYRLIIEKDQTNGSYVYKTLDRSTGEVVQQLPREEMLRLKDDPAYVSGKVIVTRA